MPIAEGVWLAAQLLCVPVLLAGTGWIVYNIACFLTFRPRNFVGPGKPFGWQGWLARSQSNLQRHLVASLSPTFKPLSQIFEYLTPQKWVVHAVQTLRPQLDTLIDEAIEKHNSVLWENMPVGLKNRFYERAHRQIPAVIDDIIEEIGDQSDHLIDIDHLFTLAGQQAPYLSTRLMEHAASPWLQAARSRFFFCLLFALIPVSLAYWYWNDWRLLAMGIYCSFCLALWYRHRSVWLGAADASKGKELTPFQERCHAECKQRFSATVAPLLADEVFTPRHWMTAVIDGPRARQTYLVAKKHVSRLVENLSIRTFAQLTIGANGYVELKTSLSTTVLNALRSPFEDNRFNQSRSARVSTLIEHKLAATFLPDIKRLLSPVFTAQTTIAVLMALPFAGAAAWIIQLYFSR